MSDVAKKLLVKPGSRVLALARPKDVALPLHPCAACSIDETWSALRVRHSSRTTPRTTSGRPVRTATAKPMKLPADLMRAVAKSPTAKATWSSLAPSHVKEYVRWVIEAKQAETHDRRIAKTVEMLAAGQRDRNAKYRPTGPAPGGQRRRMAVRIDR